MRYKHSATDWQVAVDPDFDQIVDESFKDTENLVEWHTPLKKINVEEGFYSDEDILYARVRVWFKNESSQWFPLDDNQNYQKVIITQDGKDDIHTDSTAINMQ